MKRRYLIKQINRFALGFGLLSAVKKFEIETGMNREDEIIEFARSKNIKYIAENLEQDKYSTDFGKIFKVKPRAVLIPLSTSQLKEIVLFANKKKIPLTLRGASHSSSGQSLSVAKGVSIDLREFNKIQGIESEDKNSPILSCSPGATLGQVNKFVLASNYMLPALPFFPELTVGGVLAAGGIGSASHQHGLMISSIAELEVLHCDGSLITCTATHNAEVFNAVLGTFGHFGIITNVKLKLIKSKRSYRVFRFLYEDMDQWWSDYAQLLMTPGFSDLQGIIVRSATMPPIWNFLLEVSVHGDSENDLKQHDGVLKRLKFERQLPSSDLNPEAFLNRYQSRFDEMHKTGKYDQAHPFLEFIIPAEQARDLILEALKLPNAYEDGFRIIFINKKNLPSWFMVPASPNICMFAILPAGIHENDLAECLKAAKQLHQYARSIGAKRYLSGWVGMMEEEELQQHYGSKFAALVQLKKKMDPNNLLQSQFSSKLCNWI